ncbi:Gamma-tubulin complex component 2-like protein [Frankliniella fusca]|uniref:Gamma-tubulin complex component n=1 Tax=Frankliniella fusca TaxID=407009 RepID=A0AAE1I397_9NEOP|nr:Gamma-tubulin complex component 2-like protein [Frankliniella fusca]
MERPGFLGVRMDIRSPASVRQTFSHLQVCDIRTLGFPVYTWYCILLLVTNVDQVLTCHGDFLCTCIKDCMLTNPNLLKMVNILIGVCVSFCRFFENAQRYFVDAELNSMIAPSDAESDVSEAAPSIECSTSAPGENFEDSIQNFDEQFSAALIGLLHKIDELAVEDNNEKMLNVLYRMDFNSYYSSSLLVPSATGSTQSGVAHTSG